MIKKANLMLKISLIAIFGAVLFTYSPTLGYAQNDNQTSPVATTDSATSIRIESVDMNSLITNSGNDVYGTITWFEWGTSPSLSNRTQKITVRTLPAFRHTDTVTELTPNTTYYFRAVAENSLFRSTGNILSFTTPNNYIQPRDSNLGGNAIGSGEFLPTTILGWMTLFMLVLIILILGNYLKREYARRKYKQLGERTEVH